jgi:hypothetical protein
MKIVNYIHSLYVTDKVEKAAPVKKTKSSTKPKSPPTKKSKTPVTPVSPSFSPKARTTNNHKLTPTKKTPAYNRNDLFSYSPKSFLQFGRSPKSKQRKEKTVMSQASQSPSKQNKRSTSRSTQDAMSASHDVDDATPGCSTDFNYPPVQHVSMQSKSHSAHVYII